METPQQARTLSDLGYLDPQQLAALIDVKITTLSNWRAKNFGPPATKIHGNKIVYSFDGVKKWLTERGARQTKAPTLATGSLRTETRRSKSQRRRRA